MEPGVPLAEEHVSWPVDDWLAKAKQVFTEPLAALINRDSRPTGLAQIAQGRLPGTGQRDGGLESGGLEDGDDNAGNDYAPGSDYQIITFNPLNSETLSAASQSGLNAASEPSLVQLGQELYDALFQGTIRDSWVMAQGVAQNHERPLRLRLGMKGDRLPRLPWEVLHAANRPLAAATDIVFSRYHSGHSTIAPAQFHSQFHNQAEASLPGALRILMVLSAPDDQANLELKQEALQLQQELEQQRSGDRPDQQPQIELTLLEQPGREALTQKLEQAQYQVFHFAGHSSPGPAGGKLELVNATTGLTESLNGDDLAGLLVNNGIKLAVFNSCLSTQAATSDEFDLRGERTLAEALIHRGIPSVLAMAERIPDQVALTLSRLFYRNIRLGHPLDVSLCRARQGLISSYGSNQLYWALPILYLQTHFEGRLVRSWSDAQGAIAPSGPPSSSPGGPPGYQPESPSQGLGQGRRGERSPGPLGNAGVAQLWTEEAPGPGAGAGSGTTASQGSWVPTLDDRAPSPLPLASPAVADSALVLPGSRTSAELVAGAPDRGGAIASPPSSVPGSAVPASGSAPPMTSARPGQPRRSWRSIWLGLGAIAAVGIVGGTGWGIARWVAPTPGVEVVDETPLSPRDYAETTALVDDGVSAFRRNEPAAAARSPRPC
ncbi:MAG: CHAT domain-containing protein [Synechococcales cyanobacterium RM1_1_8]|nr:CHAT domain-containing protein [Synechococcales cyanobacterium RM1_1_8]